MSVSRELTSSFSLGNAVKYGVPVAIIGRPNTGKSTLLNYLLKEERAIVSDVPGTTRDAIEDSVVIEGVQFRFTDTAGLRDTKDIIENLGIKKTHEKIQAASVVLLVADINEDYRAVNEDIVRLREIITGKEKHLVILVNKTDADITGQASEMKDKISYKSGETLLFISAKTGQGIDKLKENLIRIVDIEKINYEDVIISNARHFNALSQVTESLERVLEGLQKNIPEDLIAIDIRQAIHYLGEITGEITTDEILGNIFKNFCIGK